MRNEGTSEDDEKDDVSVWCMCMCVFGLVSFFGPKLRLAAANDMPAR